MNAHTTKTYNEILGDPAPRGIDWDEFSSMWEDFAEETKFERGDRLSVRMNGHREVFHRPHNGRVSIEDIELARRLIRSTPEPLGEGSLLVVALDDERARILDFDLGSSKVSDTEQDVRDSDSHAHRLRTVERHTGHDDVHDLTGYFEAIAAALIAEAGRPFVVLGHGAGKSNAAHAFVERIESKHHELLGRYLGVGEIDLSAANDAALEAKAMEIAGTRH